MSYVLKHLQHENRSTCRADVLLVVDRSHAKDGPRFEINSDRIRAVNAEYYRTREKHDKGKGKGKSKEPPFVWVDGRWCVCVFGVHAAESPGCAGMGK